MSTRTQKVKLVALGVLATLVGHLASTHLGPVPVVSSPRSDEVPIAARTVSAARARHGRIASEFRPVIPSSVESGAKADLDLTSLARLQQVESAGTRNLFRFATGQNVTKVAWAQSHNTEVPSGVTTAAAQLTKEPDRSPLIFYGYSLRRGSAPSAFLLKDDEIHVTTTGDPFENRYRVIAFSLTSVIIEDRLTGARETVALLQPQL